MVFPQPAVPEGGVSITNVPVEAKQPEIQCHKPVITNVYYTYSPYYYYIAVPHFSLYHCPCPLIYFQR